MMNIVTINGKTIISNGSINVTSEGIFVDGAKVSGMTDYNGKEAGKVVIVIPPNSTCSLNVQNVDAVEVRGNLDGFQGDCGSLSVGNNMSSNTNITTNSITIGNNLTAGDVSTNTATIGNNCNCDTFSGCKPTVGGKFRVNNSI